MGDTDQDGAISEDSSPVSIQSGKEISAVSDCDPVGIEPSGKKLKRDPIADENYSEQPWNGRAKHPKADTHDDPTKGLNHGLNISVPRFAKLLEFGHDYSCRAVVKSVFLLFEQVRRFGGVGQ